MKTNSTSLFTPYKWRELVVGRSHSIHLVLIHLVFAFFVVLIPHPIFAAPFLPSPAADSVPFNVVGVSFQDTTTTGALDSCYTITTDFQSESGAVWNNSPINLAYAFDLKFNITLGNHNPDQPANNGCYIGADGICFVLQNYNTGFAEQGGGIGYADFPSLSLAVEFDDFQNGWDPPYSHIAIEDSGTVDHTLPNGHLAGPVQMSNSEYYTADGEWHIVEITWNPQQDSMAVYFDDTFRLGKNFDSLGGLFQGIFQALDSNIYWGFTGSTGSYCNTARVCMNSISFVSAINNVPPDAKDVKIYPNPSNNYLNIESSRLFANLVVMDITGRVLESEPVNQQKTGMNTSNLAEGTYFLKLSTGDESSIVKKFVVVH